MKIESTQAWRTGTWPPLVIDPLEWRPDFLAVLEWKNCHERLDFFTILTQKIAYQETMLKQRLDRMIYGDGKFEPFKKGRNHA